ncbi:MAG: hypothetical protein JSU05_04130 [Bacteroidetes bacterium]|nr:hypothetical protein [Bacteroidota bacterium]
MKKLFSILVMLTVFFTVKAQNFSAVQFIDPSEKLTTDYCSPLFKYVDGTIITVPYQAAGCYNNVLNWLDGRVAGLEIYYSRNHDPVPIIRGTRATIFIDEMPVSADFLETLSIYDIAFIKVIKEPFVGSIGNNSAIAIYTLRGDEEE